MNKQWLSSLPVVMGTGMPGLRRTGMPEEQEQELACGNVPHSAWKKRQRKTLKIALLTP